MLRAKRHLLTTLRCAVVGGAVCLFVSVFRGADTGAVSKLVLGVGAGGVLLVMLPQLVALLLESFGWKLAFGAGGIRVRFGPLLRVRASTEALAQSLPLGVAFAESVKPLLLGKHCGLAVDASLSGMAARKVLLLVTQSFYVLLLALLGFAGLQGASRAVLGVPHLGWLMLAAGLALGSAGVVAGLMLRRSAIARGTLALLGRLPSKRLRAWLTSRERVFAATDGAVSAFFRTDFRRLLAPALFFLSGWLMEAVETWLILNVLGVPVSFATAASIEIAVSLVRNVVFVVPAGLGVQDLGYVSCFAAFGLPNAASVGAAFVLLKRGKELFFIAVGYGLLGSELGALLGGPAKPIPPLRPTPARA